MSDLIPAVRGWRVCVWSREQGAVIALPIVAWGRESYSLRGNTEFPERTRLLPYVLTEFGEVVQPLDNSDLFVAIMPPGDDLIDYTDAGESVARAADEAEEREHAARMADREHAARLASE